MIHIGVDLHRTFCYVTALDANGKVLHQGRINNEREAIRRYLSGWNEGLRMVFEACSFWPAFVEAVEGKVAELYMVHPQRVKAIASAKLKNDRVDSLTLAHLLRADLLPQAWLADRETRQRRTRTRTRIELGRLRTRLKNRMHALLHQQGLRCPYSDVFGKKGRAWLAEAPLGAAEGEALQRYLALLDSCEEQIRQSQRTLLAATRDDDRIRWLSSIPGIGEYGANIILAEIGDIGRFDRKALYSFAGLVPRVRESADKSWHGPITRAGSSRLRWIMVEAAVTAVRTSPGARAFFERLCQRKPRHVARVALARKLLGAVYALLRDGVCFDEQVFATM
jgi:transposase